jgi:hypothetical protein
MATETLTQRTCRTVADLLHELDDIPAFRVWLHPTPGAATEADVIEAEARSNTSREMERKLREYFAAGVRLVWYIDPATRIAQVYTSADSQPERIDEDGALDGGEVLPGFRLSIREWFARAEGTA